MLLKDRSLTNQKDGLSNALILTNQDFYIRLVDDKENNSILAGRPFSLPARFDFPPLLRPATRANSTRIYHLISSARSWNSY